MLEVELRSIFSGTGGSVVIGPSSAKGPGVKKKLTMSPEARERIAAAQRAGWAKSKGVEGALEVGSTAKATKLKKKKMRTMSPEARARIVAAQKKRWAKLREGKM